MEKLPKGKTFRYYLGAAGRLLVLFFACIGAVMTMNIVSNLIVALALLAK